MLPPTPKKRPPSQLHPGLCGPNVLWRVCPFSLVLMQWAMGASSSVLHAVVCNNFLLPLLSCGFSSSPHQRQQLQTSVVFRTMGQISCQKKVSIFLRESTSSQTSAVECLAPSSQRSKDMEVRSSELVRPAGDKQLQRTSHQHMRPLSVSTQITQTLHLAFLLLYSVTHSF